MSDSKLQEILLSRLEKVGSLNTLDLAKELDVDHQKIVGCMKSVQTFPDVIEASSKQSKTWQLSKEGQSVHANGSYEFIIFNNVPAEPKSIEQKDLIASLDNAANAKVGFSKAMQNGWILIDKSDGKQMVKRKVDSVKDQVKEDLNLIKESKFDQVNDKVKNELKKRKLIEEVVIKSFDVTKGSAFTTNLEKPETDLNSEMITKGTWKTKQFKDYNFDALGVVPDKGHLHPLLKVREQYRQIFLEMGFNEMATDYYVESSFWNFDALFVPQKHPAREGNKLSPAQDTFFLNVPKECNTMPKEYADLVKQVHSDGGFGSKGYRYDWKASEAKKNVLRTHSTAVSSKMLYKAAQEFRKSGAKSFKPMKLFSIDKVFRNETLDATHLAEFFQIEGVIAYENCSLGDLMGTFETFFRKLGITQLKFKPAYNPYTEPSMEIFSYHQGLKKWVEIGNSGMFRPEMLLPMGLPENVRVAGWGLSLERPTMIKYGIDNIRDLCGHKIDLEMVYNNPVCILKSC